MGDLMLALKSLNVIAFLTIFFFLGWGNSQAYVVDLANDSEIIALQTSGQFTKLFGGNIRWGNNAGNGDWEYSVVNAGDIPFGAENPKQLKWSDFLSTHSYTFTYSSNSDTVSLELALSPIGGGTDEVKTSSGTLTDLSVNAMILRARTGPGDTATMSDPITIDFNNGESLVINGLIGDGDANAIFIVDDRFSGGFEVSGESILTDGSGSLPMYQFKVGVGIVPIPGAFWLLASGCLALVGIRRKHKK
jgi:hypothetical protein